MFAIPILWREILELSRRRTLWIYQLVYAVAISLLFVLVWPHSQMIDPASLQASGDAFLLVVLWSHIGLICLVVPVFVATSLTGEKEKESLDLLLLSPIGPGGVIFTKCLVQLFKFFFVLVTALPILILGLSVGGISPGQLLWGTAVLLGLGFLSGCIGAVSGAFFSSSYLGILGALFLMASLLGIVPYSLKSVWPMAWGILSPFGMISQILSPAAELNSASPGPGKVLCGWIGLGLLLLLVSKKYLYERERKVRSPLLAENAHAGLSQWRRLRVSRSLLLVWRELRGKSPACSLTTLLLVFCVLGAYAGLNILFRKDLTDLATNAVVVLGLCGSATVFCLFTATAGMVKEHTQGDMELLVLTALEGRDIIRGKFAGILASCSLFLLLPCVQALLVGFDLSMLLLCLLVLDAFIPAAILAGMEGGMKSTDLFTAITCSLGRFLLLGVILSTRLVIVLLSLLLGPLLLYVPTLLAWLWFRRSNLFIGEVVVESLASQISKGGTDIEWRGVEWGVGRGEMFVAAFLWTVIGLISTTVFGVLVGIFILFLAGSVVLVTLLVGLRPASERWRQFRAERNKLPEVR